MAATYVETRNSVSTGFAGLQSSWREKLSEGFWGSVCLALFIVLGPFAAPIALAFMFSKHVVNVDAVEPDPVRNN